jgi:hypothetical protein
MINLKTTKRAKHMLDRKEKRNIYTVLVEIYEGKKHLEGQGLDG